VDDSLEVGIGDMMTAADFGNNLIELAAARGAAEDNYRTSQDQSPVGCPVRSPQTKEASRGLSQGAVAGDISRGYGTE
jgi:hypothetical protein